MPSPACRSQTLVQQYESCRPRRPAPSPRVPPPRDGSSVRPTRRDPRRTDGRCPAPALTRAAQPVGGPTGALSLGMSKSIAWTWISLPGSDSLTKTYLESPLAS